jgi:hypothetical protein
VVLGVVLAATSFLPWQSRCCGSSWNAWAGDGELAGGVMAGLAIVLVVLAGMTISGRRLPEPVPHDYLVLAVGTGAALFGLLKFLLVVGRHAAAGAFVGAALSVAVGATVAWRVRLRRVAPVRP